MRIELYTYAVFLEVVRKVGNHDLGLGGDAVLGGTALLALTGSGGLLVGLVSGECLVGGLGKSYNLARDIGGGAVRRGSIDELDLLGGIGGVSLLRWH